MAPSLFLMIKLANSVGLTGLVAAIKNRFLGLRNRKQGIANYAKG